jgi:outer membrane protein OmpA-like peptidoglycan-associated protein
MQIHLSPLRTLPAALLALGLLALPGSAAQAQTSPAAASAPAVTLDSGDREVTVDLGQGQSNPDQVKQGLFPEDSLSPETRALLERCERMQREGFRCAKPVLTYTRFLFPGVSFKWASADLPDLMKQQLQAFAEALRGRSGTANRPGTQASATVIRIEGHADATGDDAGNKLLSEKRAEAVRDYLTAQGVDKAMFKVEGRGATALRNRQDPSAAENRRVEIARVQAP